MQICSNFLFLLVDFRKVLCLHASELHQNSNASSREECIPQINIDCFILDSSHLHLTFWANFFLCLSFINNSYNNVTTPSFNQHLWSDSRQILRHQYGISVAETQTFLLAKRPQRRGARRNGFFGKLPFVSKMVYNRVRTICLEKSLNFRGSPWKVLPIDFSLKSP